MISLFGKTQWGVVDSLTGALTRVEKLPFEIGAAEGVDLRLEGDGIPDKHCAVRKVKQLGLCLVQMDQVAGLRVNGAPADVVTLVPDQDYALEVGLHLLVVHGGKDLEQWRQGLDPYAWWLFDAAVQPIAGPLPPLELCRWAIDRQQDGNSLVAPQGLTVGFPLRQLLEVFRGQLTAAEVSGAVGAGLLGAEAEAAADDQALAAAGDQGAFTCPVCWLKFDPGDIMHIAVHDALRGDPVLGEDAAQRFHATRFNERGQALDALGLPCTELACPHCRRALPPAFTEVQHHILSIVGDQSAGKSYYLSVLVKLLPTSLYQRFGVVFQDADPAGNALLNDMKKTLFSAQTPEQARLVKTQLEGIMYERLPRYGRVVALPRPFVFSLASTHDLHCRCAVIFYDNAGEHFQPGRDSADSPGAQHVASSSGVFFLFDPFNSPEFRRRIADCPDPQLEKPIVDQQDVILSELKVRIKKLLKLSAAQKVPAPLAVLVGKCDAWMHLLGATPFRDPWGPDGLSLAAIEYNSNQVRQLLLDLCPAVVANSEELSRTVLYFPVSSFGHAPVKIGAGDYVPDPRRLEPILVEIPALWMLSLITPQLVH